ncbi:MAG: hypothetical protein BWY15_01049 [Firmicutes bacterium ADurb.Bin193]|nr:MAG: hypothetical protein BWY15_01049 [Firmicutes bacterium ADurb.Bin193]
MENINSILAREVNFLKWRISKDISFFYTKHIPIENVGNNFNFAKLPLNTSERNTIDFHQGGHLGKLINKTGISGYDVLEAEIKDRLSRFYGNIRLNSRIFGLERFPQNFSGIFET